MRNRAARCKVCRYDGERQPVGAAIRAADRLARPDELLDEALFARPARLMQALLDAPAITIG
jgi:hypothetical protein